MTKVEWKAVVDELKSMSFYVEVHLDVLTMSIAKATAASADMRAALKKFDQLISEEEEEGRVNG